MNQETLILLKDVLVSLKKTIGDNNVLSPQTDSATEPPDTRSAIFPKKDDEKKPRKKDEAYGQRQSGQGKDIMHSEPGNQVRTDTAYIDSRAGSLDSA
jgi:hypothetical protein